LVSPSRTSPGRSWRVEISRSAEKQIQKLNRTAQGSIVRFLRERVQAADNPRQWGKPLHGDKGGLWRYRVGDYRLICDIQDERVTVLVASVGHRKDGIAERLSVNSCRRAPESSSTTPRACPSRR
jgi:mRNA interferase RelE/StbE